MWSFELISGRVRFWLLVSIGLPVLVIMAPVMIVSIWWHLLLDAYQDWIGRD